MCPVAGVGSEARAWVQKLNLSGQKEWHKYCVGRLPDKPPRPPDIPTNPGVAYKNNGWLSWGDWFGTGVIATYNINYRSFQDARTYALSLGLKSQHEWRQFKDGRIHGKTLPADIPRNPALVYAHKGWKSWGHWLGTGTVALQLKRYRSFRDARAFARKLNLSTTAEWMAFCRGELSGKGRLPKDIPAKPRQTYSEMGWVSMGDWLGTGNVASFLRKYRAFNKARAFARSLKLKSETEWRAFCRGRLSRRQALPSDVPANPPQTYKSRGWTSWGDWLGTRRIASQKIKYRSFKEARSFARSLHLKTGNEWRLFCAGKISGKGILPADIPVNPYQTYKAKGWNGMGDWLGTGYVAPKFRRYRSFRKARAFARKLGLNSSSEWKAFCKGELPKMGKLPADVPANPPQFYKERGWSSWGDWLGTGYVANQLRNYRAFAQARACARKLGLKSKEEWKRYVQGEFLKNTQLPQDIPRNPWQAYRGKGWAGIADWLGTDRKRKTKRHR